MTSNILFDLLKEIDKLEINFPCFIRKIDGLTKWNGLEGNEDLRIQQAIEKNFYEQDNIYSLWYLENIEQFLGVIACLTTYANPKKRNIDFIGIKEEDLIKAKIEFNRVPEGRCIYVKNLHFDAQIYKKSAEMLCRSLMSQNIMAKRCNKKLTEQILAYQQQLKCLATDLTINNCTKEECNLVGIEPR